MAGWQGQTVEFASFSIIQTKTVILQNKGLSKSDRVYRTRVCLPRAETVKQRFLYKMEVTMLHHEAHTPAPVKFVRGAESGSAAWL